MHINCKKKPLNDLFLTVGLVQTQSGTPWCGMKDLHSSMNEWGITNPYFRWSLLVCIVTAWMKRSPVWSIYDSLKILKSWDIFTPCYLLAVAEQPSAALAIESLMGLSDDIITTTTSGGYSISTNGQVYNPVYEEDFGLVKCGAGSIPVFNTTECCKCSLV